MIISHDSICKICVSSIDGRLKGGSVIGKPQHKGNSKFRNDPEVLAYVLHRGFHDSYALFEQKRIQYEMVMLFDSVQTVD